MMYWWHYGDPLPWYGMILGPIMMIAFLVVSALVIAWVLRVFGLGFERGTGRSAFDILRDRFARGEIDRAEYEERKRVLSDG